MAGALLQYSEDEKRVRTGSLLILVITLAGIPFTVFGFVIGGVFCIIGAALGLQWSPPIVVTPAPQTLSPDHSAAQSLAVQQNDDERRLSAIMFTDIVGYSSISHTDEEEALRLVENQTKIVRPLVQKYGGKEIKAMGDGFLVEFASAVEAVKCAIEIQQSMHDYELIQQRHVKTMLRIGIHLGDVIHHERDVYGDAVNVASRIQTLAPPGGICVSRQVFESVRNRVDSQFDSIGLQRLRNIADDYEVFSVGLPWTR